MYPDCLPVSITGFLLRGQRVARIACVAGMRRPVPLLRPPRRATRVSGSSVVPFRDRWRILYIGGTRVHCRYVVRVPVGMSRRHETTCKGPPLERVPLRGPNL